MTVSQLDKWRQWCLLTCVKQNMFSYIVPLIPSFRCVSQPQKFILKSIYQVWKIFGIRSSHVPIAAPTCLLPHNCWYYNWRAPASEHIGHTNLRNCAALGQALGRLLGPDQRSTTLPTGSGPVSTAEPGQQQTCRPMFDNLEWRVHFLVRVFMLQQSSIHYYKQGFKHAATTWYWDGLVIHKNLEAFQFTVQWSCLNPS